VIEWEPRGISIGNRPLLLDREHGESAGLGFWNDSFPSHITAVEIPPSISAPAVVEWLLQEKAGVNVVVEYSGRKALQAAAEGGRLEVVERLLQEKADVNAAPADYGRTALQAAVAGRP
jgi:ankyrin repeat protein